LQWFTGSVRRQNIETKRLAAKILKRKGLWNGSLAAIEPGTAPSARKAAGKPIRSSFSFFCLFFN
jgi:hypothetical protein